ncbi:MAG: hypothetical protein AB8V22_04965 [Arsenophonus endosymbiont of Dermacentor nuttalli]
MKKQIKDNNEISDWFNYHFSLDNKMTSSELRLIKKNKDYSYLYENILETYISNMDVLIYPHYEDTIFSVLDYMKLFILPAFFMGPLAGLLYVSLIAVGSTFI